MPRSSTTGSGVRIVIRAELRNRWRTAAAIAVLGGIVFGIGLACLAGARRTDSLFERYRASSNLSDLEIDPGSPSPEADAAIRSLPGVRSASYWATVSVFALDRDGQPESPETRPLTITTDGRYLDQDRVALISGRLLDPTDPTEVMVNRAYADAARAEVGDALDLALIPWNENDEPDVAAGLTHRGPGRIVGVMTTPSEHFGAALDRVPMIFVSPAFGNLLADPDPRYVGFAWYGLRLQHGEADVSRVVTRWQQLVDRHNENGSGDPDEEWLAVVRRTSDLAVIAERGSRPMVVALVSFGAIAFIGAGALMALTQVRVVRSQRETLRIAKVLGMSSREVTRAAVAVPAVAIVGAALISVVVAIGLSGRFPAGRDRVFEPDAGVDVDAIVFVGAAVAVVVLMAVAALAARRLARQRALDVADPATRPSGLVALLARSGAPTSLTTAVRFTVDPGRGAGSVPTRVVAVTIVATVALLTTTLVFGHNLATLADEPERFGFTADAMLLNDGGYGRFEPQVAGAWFSDRDDIRAWRLAGADRTSLDGREVPGFLLGPGSENEHGLAPVIVSGRRPMRAGEIAVGAHTAESFGLHIGDYSGMGDGDARRTVTAVGTAVFPEAGPVLATRTRLDDGVWADPDDSGAFPLLTAYGTPFNVALLALRPGVRAESLIRPLNLDSPLVERGSAIDVTGVVTPVEVDNAADAARVQGGFVTVIAAVAAASLLALLLAVVRRRRRELTVLAALGCPPGQLRTCVVLQGVLYGAIGVAIGLPVGIGVGRQLWRVFADVLGVVPEPTLPAAGLTVTAVGVLALAVLIAVAPARLAAGSGQARLATE